MSTVITDDAPVAAPLRKKDRILFLDAMRGIALLGILLMNSMAQSQAHYFYNALNLDQPIVGPNFWAWVIEMGFFEGTMRGLFSILFGAGSILLINRLEKTRGHMDAADIFYRRLLWLLLFGLINAYVFLWPGDILYYYALCGLVLFPFRKMRAGMLWLCVIIMVAFGIYRDSRALYDKKEIIAKGKQAELLKSKHKTLSKEQNADLEKWQGFRGKASTEGWMKAAREETAKVQTASWAKLLAFYTDVNVKLEGAGFYNSWWDIMAFFFIGMVLYNSGFLTGEKPGWLYVLIAVFGIGLGLAINYIGLKEMYHARFDYVKLTESAPLEMYQVRRILQTLGYLSLFILLYKVSIFRRVFNVFVPVGQMAFTNYLSQSIITSVIFYAFGLYGHLQRYQVYGIVACIWIFQIIVSTVWLKYFKFGPFEWVWRSLTYKKAQPLKREKAEEDESVTTVNAPTVAVL